MGAALLQHALRAQPEPLKSLKVHSAGVATLGGEPASPNAVAALRKVGRRITQEMLDQALLVLCMTESHRDMIELSANPVPGRLYLFREFTGDPLGQEIPDPYGMHLSAYEACRDELVDAIPSIVKFLSELPADAVSRR
jgi:protein-tyrosine phosphatase